MRGPGEFVIIGCLAPTSPPLQRKFSPDFYVLHGPHWAAQGGPDPWTPRPATPLAMQQSLTIVHLKRVATLPCEMFVRKLACPVRRGSFVGR